MQRVDASDDHAKQSLVRLELACDSSLSGRQIRAASELGRSWRIAGRHRIACGNRAQVDEYLANREKGADKLQKEMERRFPPEGLRARLLARREA